MKKYILLFGIIGLLFSSCSIIQPDSIDYWKKWVFLRYSNEMYGNALAMKYISDRFQEDIDLTLAGDYTDDESGDASWSEYKVYYFLAEDYVRNGISDYDFSKTVQGNVEAYFDKGYYLKRYVMQILESSDYCHEAADYYAELTLNNDKLFENIAQFCATITTDLFPQYAELVVVEDWWWIAEFSGDTYDTYQVIYNIDNKRYVLCTILEKEDGSSEISVVDSSNRLLDLLND